MSTGTCFHPGIQMLVFRNMRPIYRRGSISSSTLLCHGCLHYLLPICTVGMLGSFTVMIVSDWTRQVALTAQKPKRPRKSWKNGWAALLLLCVIFPSSLSLIPAPEALLGGTASTQHRRASQQPAELCQPTSSSETCGACKVSGHPSSSHLVTSVTSLYKELGTGKKLAFPLASNLISGFKVQWIQRM